MEQEINRLFRSLDHSKKKFDQHFTILHKFLYKFKVPENHELTSIAVEFYSWNCIKIEYELLTNNKLGFLNMLRNHPSEKIFIYEGLPPGLTSIYDLLDKKKTKDENGVTAIDDLRLLRDKVVCHCDPDNYEVREIVDLANSNVAARSVIEQQYFFLKKRKEVIDKYFNLINCIVGIMNSNIEFAKLRSSIEE